MSDARDHTSTDRQNLGYAMLLHSDRVAAAFGLREEICRRGLEGSEEDVTERCPADGEMGRGLVWVGGLDAKGHV